MEKPRTQADVRREQFAERARVAQELGDYALRRIDAALAEEEMIREGLVEAVRLGTITPEDMDSRILAFRATRRAERPDDAA